MSAHLVPFARGAHHEAQELLAEELAEFERLTQGDIADALYGLLQERLDAARTKADRADVWRKLLFRRRL